ncbi:MAG: 4Fe-4S binding protein [Candidatus Izimaplasma sp.]|nr:4Fe-4S binding protein [Candidatus Izimaplasma bacterium]
MNTKSLYESFKTKFDVVGIIKTSNYLSTAKKLNITVPNVEYPTIVVVGLSYPKRIINHTKTHLAPSFYTFGMDYHKVITTRIDAVMKNLPYEYLIGVDNHPHNERLAARVAKIGYFGKNQLIINKELGTYMFLGLVFINEKINDEYILNITDDCGECRKCIEACPTNALFDGDYDINKCISYYNQAKKDLNNQELKANYSLFGCDICQLVCPKNINIDNKTHSEFELSGKELVSIVDLFTLSNKDFKEKYNNMAYLWKGKTILMRNALAILYRQNNKLYNDLIKDSIKKHPMSWYKDTATKVLKKLEN